MTANERAREIIDAATWVDNWVTPDDTPSGKWAVFMRMQNGRDTVRITDATTKASAERDLEIVRMCVARVLAPALDAARREGFEAGRDAAAKVAEAWSSRQDESARRKLMDDCPGSAAEHECSAAIGRRIAAAIRALSAPAEAAGGKGTLPDPKCWWCSYRGTEVYRYCERPDCGERASA